MSLSKVALSAVFGIASVAQAGMTITFVPTNAGPYNIQNPASLGPFNVDIFLTADPGSTAEGLRLLRFDFSDSSPALTLDADGLLTFRYTGVTGIPSSAGYSQFRNLPVPNTVYTSSNYPNGDATCPECTDGETTFPWNLNMMVVPPSGAYRVGSLIGFRLPAVPGEYLLDAMNADSGDFQNASAHVTYGFGVQQGDERTDLVPGNQLWGGQLWFTVVEVFEPDCNNNGILDECDLSCNGTCGTIPGCGQSDDCNANGILDECDIASCTGDPICVDCNTNLIPDVCELSPICAACPDCNGNLIPDDCDVADCPGDPACADCNANSIPDGCEADCNSNGVPDECDVGDGNSLDCDANGVPDECQLEGDDCNANSIPDGCESDCNANGIPDECDVRCAGGFCGCQGPFGGEYSGASSGLIEASVNCGGEVNLNFVSAGGLVLFQTTATIETPGDLVGDGHKIVVSGFFDFETCSAVGTWRIAGGTEGQWNIQLARECLPDCNGNDNPDECDLARGASFDCNGNDVPDECEDPPVFRIVSSQPPDGIIDARQDRSITGLTPQGFDRLRLSFSCQPFDAESDEPASSDSFDVTSTVGSPPLVLALQSVEGAPYTFDVILSDPIPPGAWTTITASVVSPDGIPIDPAGNRVRLGLLPGDVNGNGAAAPADILDLIDNLNRIRMPPLAIWQCDIDRSGLCVPADILREIDLLNGVNTTRAWNGVRLPPMP